MFIWPSNYVDRMKLSVIDGVQYSSILKREVRIGDNYAQTKLPFLIPLYFSFVKHCTISFYTTSLIFIFQPSNDIIYGVLPSKSSNFWFSFYKSGGEVRIGVNYTQTKVTFPIPFIFLLSNILLFHSTQFLEFSSSNNVVMVYFHINLQLFILFHKSGFRAKLC